MSALNTTAIAAMAIGIVAVLRATLVIARRGAGRSRLDLPISILGGFCLILVGQALLTRT